MCVTMVTCTVVPFDEKAGFLTNSPALKLSTNKFAWERQGRFIRNVISWLASSGSATFDRSYFSAFGRWTNSESTAFANCGPVVLKRRARLCLLAFCFLSVS